MCVRGVGACFCPEILARATLTEEQLSSLMILRLGKAARYPISFGHQDKSYQWSIINAFMSTAREVMAKR